MGFPKHMAWRGIIFWLVTHGCPVFPSTQDKPNAYVYNPNLQSNQTEAKQLQPELFRRKSGVEKISTNIFDSGISGNKIIKRLNRWELEAIQVWTLLILVRKPPDSLISPGCYTSSWLCACGGNSRGGLPQFSLFCLFTYICWQKICNWRWILHLCSY